MIDYDSLDEIFENYVPNEETERRNAPIKTSDIKNFALFDPLPFKEFTFQDKKYYLWQNYLRAKECREELGLSNHFDLRKALNDGSLPECEVACRLSIYEVIIEEQLKTGSVKWID